MKEITQKQLQLQLQLTLPSKTHTYRLSTRHHQMYAEYEINFQKEIIFIILLYKC